MTLALLDLNLLAFLFAHLGAFYFTFYPSQIPVNYTICFKKAILSKVKNRFNKDYYSKTYNQNDFFLYLGLIAYTLPGKYQTTILFTLKRLFYQ